MKIFFTYTLLAIINFVINFTIYNFSFNYQATPYLHESQRLDSGILMLQTTIPAYAVATILIAVCFYFVARLKNRVE